MKIGYVLCLVPTASASVVDDVSSMLTLGTHSSVMAANLLDAVGHRNVTSMQALVQELAEESLTGVGQLDPAVKEAVQKIKEVFVKSIQAALKEQHKADQEHFNCFTKDCFGGCMTDYKNDLKVCDDLSEDKYPCDGSVGGQYEFVHDGHCASGWPSAGDWVNPGNVPVDSISACAARCLTTAGCAYFSYDEANADGGCNCALYTDAGCKDDDKYATYKSYKMTPGVHGNWTLAHDTCREETLIRYKTMAETCGVLHCFDVKPDVCDEESCTCGDLTHCHREDSSGECKSSASEEDCNDRKHGTWLQGQITKYKRIHEDWKKKRDACSAAYKEFLKTDTACDSVQKDMEKCFCDRNKCEEKACQSDYDDCEGGCWKTYSSLVESKECLERDRKIDWSATKKIECYIDVLLEDYTTEQLIKKCGKEDCISTAREEDYKACEQVCPNIDHDGNWPDIEAASLDSPDGVTSHGHKKRAKKDDFMLGDGEFACDNNGDSVFTKHRGGAHREGEARCTEHLDIDYQIPQCMACRDAPPPVCDGAFHKKHYLKFDDASKMVYDGCDAECPWAKHPVEQETYPEIDEEGTLTTIKIKQHSEAWAYNRCECTDCLEAMAQREGRPAGRQCGLGADTLDTMGAHAISSDAKKHPTVEFKNVCIGAAGGQSGTVQITEDICVKRVTLTHRSGTVSCRKQDHGDSKWGCDQESLGVVLTDSTVHGHRVSAGHADAHHDVHQVVVAPVFDTTVGMTPHYSKHAHWYRMDGVNKDTPQMAWTFHEPYKFTDAAYNLWYNEDLSGGTESDNRGQACYDLAFETVASCNALAPLQFDRVCVSATSNKPSTINLPDDTCVSEIAIHHTSGKVSCRRADSGKSHFGCDNNMVGLVWLPHGKKDVKDIIMPKEGQVKGVRRTHHTDAQAHWYLMDSRGFGQGRDINKEDTLHMKLNEPLKMGGKVDLWYNEDLTGWTESDNSGEACYEVSVHRATSC